ncbi:MAG: amidase, partial [Acetobacteraceae bacterium]
VRAREVSPLEIADLALARIERLNPALNAFILLYPDETRAAAREAGRRARGGEAPGPLHGVPVSIKDTYWSRGRRMAFGSRLMAGHVPVEDSPPVARLCSAGAIDIGKTNTPEFAWRGSTDNPLFGATANPWDLARTPGGSSGGAAAAVATGLGPLALGSDAAGSIRIPASFCGLVGFKPTFGRVAMYPPAGGNELALHGGPLTRTVRDAALMFDAIAGYDARDPFSLPGGTNTLAELDRGIAGQRLAWSPDLGFAAIDPEVLALAESAARAFEEAGLAVAPADLAISDPGWILDALFGASSAGNHGARPATEKAVMDPALVAYAERSLKLTVGDYMRAIAARQALVLQLVRAFRNFDLLLTPTVAVPAFPLDIVGPVDVAGRPVTHLGWSLCYPFNWSGQPAITVPAGWTRGGLPVGLQIVGRRHEDPLVLRAAALFEQLRPWADRRPKLAAASSSAIVTDAPGRRA